MRPGFLLLLWAGLGEGMRSPTTVSSFHVVSAIRMRFATTQLTQKVLNIAKTPKEFTFVAVIPENALVSNFTMEAGGYESVGRMEKLEGDANVYDMIHQTRKILPHAPLLHFTLGHLFMGVRVFTSVAVLGAESEMTFVLTYEEVLERRHGVYRALIPVPHADVEDMRIHVRILERGRIEKRKLKVAQFSPSTDLHTNAQLLKLPGEKKAKVRPSISREVSAVDITFRPKGAGQFVLLYDLSRYQNAGHMEISDGHFVHFLAPPAGRKMFPGSRNVLFLLDVSATMRNKWRHVMEGVRETLEGMNDYDLVNVLLFNDGLVPWQLQSLPANRPAKEDVLRYIQEAVFTGKSDLRMGLSVGADLLRVDKSAAMVNLLLVVTDTKPNGENSGRRREAEILEALRRSSGKRVSVNVVGLGKDSHIELLHKVAAAGMGTARLVHLNDYAAENIAGFFAELSSPLLREVGVTYDSEAVQTPFLVSQQGVQTRDYFAGNELILAGKINMTAYTPASIRVTAVGQNARGRQLSFRSVAKIRSNHAESEDRFTRRIWAFLTIKGLLRIAEEGQLNAEMKEKVLNDAKSLAVEYSYLSRVTALRVVPLEVDWSMVERYRPTTTTLPPPYQQLILIPPDSDPLRDLVLSLEKGFNPLLFSKPRPQPQQALSTTPAPEVVRGEPRAAFGVPLRLLLLLQTDDEVEDRRAELDLPMLQRMELAELKDFLNPSVFSGHHGMNMSSMVGPVASAIQEHPEMMPSLDPGTRHFISSTRDWIQPCGFGEELDGGTGGVGDPGAPRDDALPGPRHPPLHIQHQGLDPAQRLWLVMSGDEVDVVFALDVSEGAEEEGGSVLPFLLNTLTQRVVSSFAFNHQVTRVGLVAFSGNPDKGAIIYRLNQNQNPNAVVKVLQKTDVNQIPEDADNIFRLGYRLFKEAPNRAAKRSMVVLSNRNDFARYQSVIKKVREAGLKFYAIAPNEERERVLGGLLELVGGDESLVFTVPNPLSIAAQFCS